MKTHTYTVRGKWPFPIDMLRHGDAIAASAEDQRKIDRYSMEHAPDRDVFQPVEITLVGPWAPNCARWESFGWEVPYDQDWQRHKRALAEERRQDALRQSALAKLTSEERQALGLKEGDAR